MRTPLVLALLLLTGCSSSGHSLPDTVAQEPTTGTAGVASWSAMPAATADRRQEAIGAALATDEGKATAADFGQIAPPGSRMFVAQVDG